ncbi:hypothetical protein CDEF62S_00948 [Castellaniella defragrans]
MSLVAASWMGGLGVGFAVLVLPWLRRHAAALSVRLGGASVHLASHPWRACLLGLALGAACGLRFGASPQGWAALCLSMALLALAWIDLETGLLPDALTLPLLGVGWVLNAFGVFTTWPHAVAGSLLGYWFLWGVEALYRRWMHRAGLGGGDLKCVAALGAWLGWQALPGLLFLAAVLSLVGWGLAASCGRPPRRDQAFGPALALSGLAMLFTVSSPIVPWVTGLQ